MEITETEIKILGKKDHTGVVFSTQSFQQFLVDECCDASQIQGNIVEFFVRNHDWKKEEKIGLRSLEEKVNIISLGEGCYIRTQQQLDAFTFYIKINNEVYRKQIVTQTPRW
jgi:hypothetical protein